MEVQNVIMDNQAGEGEIVGKFTPKIVKMDGAKHKGWGKKGREDVTGE